MTTEEAAFAAALAADPFDALTRSVYADWLREQCRDEDEAKQRDLVELWAMFDVGRYRPYMSQVRNKYEWWIYTERDCDRLKDSSDLPSDWFAALEGGQTWPADCDDPASRDYNSLRGAYIAAARAFAKLPKRRRAELLRGHAAGA